MKAMVLVFIAGFLMSAGAAYLIINPDAAPAAAATISDQTKYIIFDTSRIVELLRTLLSMQASAPSPVFTPSAGTTTIPFAPSSATSTTNTSSATSTKNTTTPKKVATSTPVVSSSENRLRLMLPSLRSALVNIVCLPKKAGTGLRGVSGTGVIIDPQGIILTVAHVAQYELLAEARPDLISCVVRAGSPALNAYVAKPVYVSSAWINENAKALTSADPRGSGENDFALLAITDSATNSALPASFPFVPISPVVPTLKDPVVIGSYGAEFLTSATIRAGIFPTLVFGSVHERYTFGTQTIDVVSLGGGAAAQEGSSGGGAINEFGQLIGLITTRSSGDSLQDRDLRAITNTYLQRAFRAESGSSLSNYVEQDPGALVKGYAAQANSLASQLLKANRIGN